MRLSTLLATVGLALILTLNLSAQTVRVIFVSGQASLQRPDEAALRPALKGETVIIGTRIVTGPDGRLVLTPMPGVKSIVAPNTTLVLESSSESRVSATEVKHQAIIDLQQGAVVTDLHKPEGVSYDYSIRTARGLAGARGTTFTVGINKFGVQTVIVSHGVVSLTFTDGHQVNITPGNANITKTDGGTQSIAKVNELSGDDQKVAQNWANITIDAITTAIESGIELQPDALNTALTAIQSLGIVLPPELQTRVDKALTPPPPPPPDTAGPAGTDTPTVQEVITAQAGTVPSTFASIHDFKATLNSVQLAALDEILNLGGFQPLSAASTRGTVTVETPPPTPLQKFEAGLGDAKFVQGVRQFIDFYASLPVESGERSVLTSLGILGNANFTVFGTDTAGLQALLTAYAYLDISAPVRLDELDFAANRTGTPPVTNGNNYFFPGTTGRNGQIIYNVTFGNTTSPNLYVGATRQLRITNGPNYDGDAFGVANFGHIELRAGELVDLDHTRFSSGVSSILIAASTINLTNVNFPAGSFVELQAKTASVNFRTDTNNAPVPGKVNFRDVSYGSTLLTPTNFGDGIRGTSADGTGGNITVNALGKPPR